MRDQTYLLRRGSQYYFRIRIPPDLRPRYDGRWEIKQSLRTTDKREAIQLCRVKAIELTAEFERFRHQRDVALGKEPPRRITRIDDKFISELKSRWLWESLANDDAQRREGLDEKELAELRSQADETQHVLKDALACGNVAVIQPALGAMLYMLGVKLDVPDDDYRRLAYAYLQTAAEANELIRKRNAGDVVETQRIVNENQAYPLTPSQAKKLGFMDLFDYWASAVTRRSKTKDTYKATVTLFLDIVGNKPIDELRKADFVAFKDALQARGLHYKTVDNKLIHLKSILNLAVANDRIEANVAASVQVTKPKVEPVARLPFDADDLTRIFGSPIYSTGKRPEGGAGEASVWLPLLSLYSGARENELGQLLVGDVLKDPVAGYFIHVTDEGDDDEDDNAGTKTVKTVASRRKVPLHPALITAGFIKYRDHMAKLGATQLFPDLKPDRHGHITGNWSKWFGRYLRKDIGITNRKKVFHSLRHSFKDACRDAGLPEDVHDALTGHVGGTVGRDYGRGHSLRTLAKAIAKVKYPGLTVPTIPVPAASSRPGRKARAKVSA
ncbi:MAG: phage integrase N-terminal SAM-like domain-containing protein [Sterolibacteriaceae bacterium MAG5]|nr:phage integrase N-terminal SAM-like domain-containing protein [Candidatus Nitricoxidireducens bremensis]